MHVDSTVKLLKLAKLLFHALVRWKTIDTIFGAHGCAFLEEFLLVAMSSQPMNTLPVPGALQESDPTVK